MTPALEKYIAKKGDIVNRALDRFLPKTSVKPGVIHDAMRYSVNAGGKRLRPILVIAGAELCGGEAEQVMPVACALELIHTYSLIHDDLPAMDDDDMRRGKLTNHKVYGEDIAILAGDGLLTLAFKVAALNAEVKGVSAKNVLKAIEIIADAAGTYGMVGGQVADIQADAGRWKRNIQKYGFSSPENLLDFIHLRKTAALIRGSLTAGGTLVGGTAEQLEALDEYGESIGLAFQIADDILDRVGDKEKLGKRGSDAENEKLTFPAIFGLADSGAFARKLVEKSHKSLKIFGKKAEILHDLADYTISRDR